MHIMTEPYLSLLVNLPRPAREMSTVYLDGEKDSVNDYAVRRLADAGYSVYYVNRLHGKVIVIGSKPDYIVLGTANLTQRSLRQFEAVIIVENPPRYLYRQLRDVFIRPVVDAAYTPRILL